MNKRLMHRGRFVLLVVAIGLAASGPAGEVRAEAASADEQQLPLSAFNIYRGNTHAHTIYTWSHGEHRVDWSLNSPLREDWDAVHYSNYQGPPARHFHLAKANGYDFYVVTDHSHEQAFPLVDYVTGHDHEHVHQPVDPQNNHAWVHTLAAAEHYTDESFLAMAGIEFSRNPPFDKDNTGTGHLNAINISQYVSAANTSLPEFYDWLKQIEPAGGEGYVVASFNHPGRRQFNDWDYLDDQIVEIITMFELRTVRRGQPRWTAYVRALNQGWKVSPITVQDNHGYWHILNHEPLTYVLAPELTKAAITRAMRQRRTFTSWNNDVELRYSVNGHIMGSTLDRPDTFQFDIQVSTHLDRPQERVRRIQILRDHPTDLDRVEVAAEMHFDGDDHAIEWATTIEDPTARYFLLRVHHGNDVTEGSFHEHGSTYAAPVWTGR